MEREPSAGHGSSGRFRYGPIAVETREFRRPVPPVAFDCAKLLLIREGSTILTTGNETRIASEGDLVFLRTAVLCGGTPEQSVTISTVYIDTDYLFELWFWLTAPTGHSREAMRAYALGPDFLPPLSYVRPTPGVGRHLELIFDDLAASLASGPDGFYHAQALVSELLHIVAPLVGARPPRTVTPPASSPVAAPPRQREFVTPLRAEAIAAQRALHADMARRWSIGDLAEEVHLSRRQLTRVFSTAFGLTPMVYLSMVRSREMARLLSGANMTVATAASQVGWRSRSHAIAAFRRSIGVTPDQYRSAQGVRDADIPDLDWDAIERTA
ncbi:helix-turn-helix transcriptional regulator [Microbacterium schleiferi]|uniref:Helix-turn-helix transcriptional regulator n=1 Tax=Microbacterium schleiferi TaxID=69362 RepID=A0A7S8RGG9_9MICO|nr:AraC family transcriptional regulator [Microbacterium schleiferi]QPE03362.1 helix-turn-helix transcriptional regulator [Microbacterium schleiferi]